jgi:hypothetical protein
MIYIGALRMFWLPFVLTGCAAIAAKLMKLSVASRCLSYGLAGSVAGYAFAPLVGVLVGLVPSIMVEPQYFTRPFNGCIAPFALFLACMTSITGVLLGFVAAGYVRFRGRTRA